jgi:tetratricopeptide (TPR) repeat protein
MARPLVQFALAALFFASAACFASGRPMQDKQTDKSQPPAPASSSSSSSSSSSAPEAGSTYDPFHAQQDVEVGLYYMHKGDIDAAIARFEDAIRMKSSFAKPRLLLAQAYEKKGDKTTALKYFREYLRVFPDAPDAKKIQAKIAKLATSN